MNSIRVKIVEEGETVYDKKIDWKDWAKTHRKGGGSPYCIESDSTRVEITIKGL